jgi:hypothetical protein
VIGDLSSSLEDFSRLEGRDYHDFLGAPRVRLAVLRPLDVTFELCFSEEDAMKELRSALQTKSFWLLLFALCASANPVFAASPFDGAWNLLFVTQYGACDPTYNFSVQIRNGILFHPNLRRLTGRVAPSGAVHASVAVEQKYAVGSGRLSTTTGRGSWKGRSGAATCGGYWTAQRG